ncbi:hypothetical protein [Rhodoplanes roseus]|uniref:hypothetical protein n=1 Tax=Rhodoplanes roseus TaxID=29409 RepID=UPI001AEC9D5E|nr:hypothetical protein [Rhodoplanes roseus]
MRDRFWSDYRAGLRALAAINAPSAVCTIYEPRFADPLMRRVAAAALALLNDVITREAFDSELALVDLRLVCARDEDFANPIEPSAIGARRIADAVRRYAEGAPPATRVFR